MTFQYIENKVEELEKRIEALEQEHCDDCISRQAAIDYFFRPYSNEELYSNIDLKRILEKLPPVKPEQKRGKWEYVQYDGNPNIGNWHCSECRLIVDVPWKKRWSKKPEYNYCPNCGAKMQEVEE